MLNKKTGKAVHCYLKCWREWRVMRFFFWFWSTCFSGAGADVLEHTGNKLGYDNAGNPLMAGKRSPAGRHYLAGTRQGKLLEIAARRGGRQTAVVSLLLYDPNTMPAAGSGKLSRKIGAFRLPVRNNVSRHWNGTRDVCSCRDTLAGKRSRIAAVECFRFLGHARKTVRKNGLKLTP